MSNKKNLVIVVIIVVLAAAAGTYWYFQSRGRSTLPPTTGEEAVPLEAQKSLGGEIYEKAKNPLQGQLEQTNPMGNVNPIEEAYKNPFE